MKYTGSQEAEGHSVLEPLDTVSIIWARPYVSVSHSPHPRICVFWPSSPFLSLWEEQQRHEAVFRRKEGLLYLSDHLDPSPEGWSRGPRVLTPLAAV